MGVTWEAPWEVGFEGVAVDGWWTSGKRSEMAEVEGLEAPIGEHARDACRGATVADDRTRRTAAAVIEAAKGDNNSGRSEAGEDVEG